MADNGIAFDLLGVGYLIKDRLLKVPVYQRSYAWEQDQVDDFCNDLKNAFNAQRQEYFLGTVVLSQEGGDGRDAVIDGQQRIATTVMLLAAIRDYFRAADESSLPDTTQSKAADTAHGKYIGSYDDEEDEIVARLFLNADDNQFFFNCVVSEPSVREPSRDSHRLIASAFDTLKKFVQDVAASAGPNNARKEVVAWRKFIEEQVRVIAVTVPTESDAFMIFETLNDRGADLTLADLLKNYLFGRAGSAKLQELQKCWVLALGSFDLDVELFVTFVKHYWSSKNGAVRERDLYKSIKNDVTSATKALNLAKSLETESRLYAALLNSEHEYWSDWGTATQNNIAALGRFGLEQNRPMLLAAVRHMTKNNAKKVLSAAVGWSVRGLIVGGIGGGVPERTYCEAAGKIRQGDVKTVGDLLKEISIVVPTDDQFEAAFATARVTKAGLARYYLLALEAKVNGDSEPELVPNADEGEVNLEHVLPKKPSNGDWPSFDEDEHRLWLHRIGNLALLSKTPNMKIGNDPFEAKKPILKASKLSLTSSIADEKDWTKAEIDKRQAELAKMAVEVWPR